MSGSTTTSTRRTQDKSRRACETSRRDQKVSARAKEPAYRRKDLCERRTIKSALRNNGFVRRADTTRSPYIQPQMYVCEGSGIDSRGRRGHAGPTRGCPRRRCDSHRRRTPPIHRDPRGAARDRGQERLRRGTDHARCELVSGGDLYHGQLAVAGSTRSIKAGAAPP